MGRGFAGLVCGRKESLAPGLLRKSGGRATALQSRSSRPPEGGLRGSEARCGVIRFKVRLWRETFIEQEQTITDSYSPWGAWRIRNEHDGIPVRRRYFGGGRGNDVPGVRIAGRGPGDSGHHLSETEPAARAGDCADARA